MSRENNPHEVACRIRRSVRYHRARERFFCAWASVIAFVSLVSGSSVVVTILGSFPDEVAVAAGAIIVLAQAVEVTYGLSSKATTHRGMAAEFLGLEINMNWISGSDSDAYERLLEYILRIEMREPPIKRYLDLICHNQVARAMGSDDVVALYWWQRWFAQYLSGDSAMEHVRQ